METSKTSANITEQDHLNLLEKLLRRKDRPERKRRQVLNYCRAHFLSESKIWRELCLFRGDGPAGILFGKEPLCVFDYADGKLRERILALINKLPVGTLSDFRELTIFTDNFRDRVKFLSDLVLGLFLDREKGSGGESADTARYTAFFVQKMFTELDFIHDIAGLLAIERVNTEYESRLCDKFMDEEVLI
jgi:hypothetical protein